jgi:dTDP-4-amino-4,6-dideoxygalactose transaminase
MSQVLKDNKIPFNRPFLSGRELSYISEAHLAGQLAGDGLFTNRCQHWLEALGSNSTALLTHSCTAALEMAAILCDLRPGDEVIMPSYTFVSTANAFVLRGAVPVFVDIRLDTLNIDETKIEHAITPRTRAIVPVHYAGVACDMDAIMDIARRHKLMVIEDAAQACMTRYKGRALGTIGHMGCFSFHETKNIISGEGGALMLNDAKLVARAEIIREKGTNRTRFLRGEVDKYTWHDIGSSFLPGEVIAAFLWGQMEEAQHITQSRLGLWRRYDSLLKGTESVLRRPTIPSQCEHNAHLYYVLNLSPRHRDDIIQELKGLGISCLSHYEPLHTSPFGRKLSRNPVHLPVTDFVSTNLIRLPLWIGLTAILQDRIIESLKNTLDIGSPAASDPTRRLPASLTQQLEVGQNVNA